MATPSNNVLGKRERATSNADTASPSEKTPQTKYFRCADCDKSYSRVDHLARHVRQHTQERPYICGECNKGFARADLLKRHASVHSATDGTGSARKPNRQGRVNQACIACAELHLKCDNEKPCQRCKSKNIYCQYQARQPDDEAVAHDLLSLSQQPVQADYTRSETAIPHHQANRFAQDATSPSQHQQSLPTGYEPRVSLPLHTSEVNNGYSDFNNDFGGSDLRDFLQGVMGQQSAPAQSNAQSGIWTPRNLFELGVNTDLELNDMDRDLLANYSLNNPFGVSPDTSNASSDPNSEPPVSGVEPMQKASTWRFRPVSRDNRDNNLSLPPSTTRRLVIARRVTKEPLSYITRDLILALLIAARNQPLHATATSALPSVELLDSLLQFYLASVPSSDQFLHTPTYDPMKARPELTTALLAAGAVLTPDRHLRKLGFALHEASRGAVAQALETDNTLIRHLEILQASYLSLSIGLWSGNSRKMEIAESFVSVFITMMRRGSWFRSCEEEAPRPEDNGPGLEAKWRRWAEQESKKRLVFLFFKHDASASIIQSINPVVSYAELHLPLPYPQDLWIAGSAQAWKDIYLTKYQSLQPRPPSVIELLRKVDHFGHAQNIIDDRVAIRALMCCSWGMVREWRQQSAINQGMQSHWGSGSSLLLVSRLNEIKSLLKYLRMMSGSSASDALFLEIQSMHLAINLEDVHIFAGIEGQDEARRAYPALLDWVRTPEARQAVYHAGQIARSAAQISFIRNFEAVAVYQAGLALWAYGVISDGHTLRDTGIPGRMIDDFVAMNGFDNDTIQRFLTLNQGNPGLAGAGNQAHDRVLLSDPAGIMLHLINLLRVSHKTTQVPPLIENLSELMKSLGAAVRADSNVHAR